MIGQHLLMRCTKGAYDTSVSPGFKTAAVSEQMKRLPKSIQSELDSVIKQYASVPEGASEGGALENRGILRIIQKRNILYAIRTFRVGDLCSNSGTVSFSHTYVFSDSDRLNILQHPEALTLLSSFDDYDNVNKRCGGLGSKQAIPIDTDLVMPNSNIKPISYDIFEKAGFDEDSFAQLVAAICLRVSSHGSVVVLLPEQNEEQWNRSGGSLMGEQFLAAIMRILPLCIVRFFSGLSFWNESVSYGGIQDIKLRIISGRNRNDLNSSEISLFDMQNDVIETHLTDKVANGAFGRYLWSIRNYEERISDFHQYIESMFGEKVDSILKMPSLMDTLTMLYDPSSESERQNSIIRLLMQMKTSVALFPQMDKEVDHTLETMLENPNLKPELETIFLMFIKEKNAKKMLCYRRFLVSLIQSVWAGNAQPTTVDYIEYAIVSADAEHHEVCLNRLMCLIEALKGKDNSPENYALNPNCWRMVKAAFMNKTVPEDKFHELERFVVRVLGAYKKRKQYLECYNVCITYLNNPRILINKDDKLPLILKTIYSILVDMVQEKLISLDALKGLPQELLNHVMILESKDIESDPSEANQWSYVDCFFYYFFLANEEHSVGIDLTEYPEYLAPFIRCRLTLHNNLRFWEKNYVEYLKEYGHTPSMLDSSQFLLPLLHESNRSTLINALQYIESAKIKFAMGYHLNWEPTEEILSLQQDVSVENLAFIHVFCKLAEENVISVDSYIERFCESDISYKYYIYHLTQNETLVGTPADGIENTGGGCSYISLIETYLIKRHHDFLDRLFANIDNQTAPAVASKYYDLWRRTIMNGDRVNSISNMSDSEFVIKVRKAEKRVLDCSLMDKYRVQAMQPFIQNRISVFNDLELLGSSCTDFLKLIQDGIQNYEWQKYYKQHGGFTGEDQINDVISLAFMIDDDKLTMKMISGQLEAFTRAYDPGSKPSVFYLRGRMKDALKKRKNVDSLTLEDFERYALYEIILVFMSQKREIRWARDFLLGIDAAAKQSNYPESQSKNTLLFYWYTPQYLFAGHKHITELSQQIEGGGRLKSCQQSFSEMIRVLITKPEDEVRKSILGDGRKIFDSYRGLLEQYEIASYQTCVKRNNDVELIEMFNVQVKHSKSQTLHIFAYASALIILVVGISIVLGLLIPWVGVIWSLLCLIASGAVYYIALNSR